MINNVPSSKGKKFNKNFSLEKFFSLNLQRLEDKGGFLQIETLSELNPYQEEKAPWYLLPGTGFNIRLQVDQFLSDIKEGTSLDAAFQKIEQDIQAFKIEYLCEGLLFPIVLDFKEVNGQKRIVAPLYNNKLLVETTTEQERAGAVKKSITQLEKFLLEAPKGSIAVMTSPAGWSGFDGITYQDTQTYIWQVQQDGKLRGFSARTDMTVEHNKKLLTYLGVEREKLDGQTAKENLINIVANSVFITRDQNQKQWQIEDVVSIIKYVKNSPFAYKNRFFDEIYESLKNPERLWTLDETTQKLLDEFKNGIKRKIESGNFTRRDIEIALGTTVLKLAQLIRRGRTNYYQPQTTSIRNIPLETPVEFRAILEDVRSIPGCAGGGSSPSIFAGSLSPRFTGSLFNFSSEKTLNCECPFCHTKVDAVISDGKITCPNCEKSAPYEC